ncbi:MAG: hypothetical protein ACI9OJ_001578 [Myxococcota bacterium]|jgi:hypothetical protein
MIVAWRAGLGLNFGVGVPDEKTVRDFERFMHGRHTGCDVPRYMLLHEHVIRLCLTNGVVGTDPQWVMDSTPMWCFGAVLDTLRRLGDGLRMLARDWARATLAAGAAQRDAPHLMAPSTKGAFAVNWKDMDARAGVVEQLAATVVRCVGRVTDGIAFVRRGLKKRTSAHSHPSDTERAICGAVHRYVWHFARFLALHSRRASHDDTRSVETGFSRCRTR